MENDQFVSTQNSTSRSTRERNGWILLATKIKARTAEGRWIKNPVWPSSCVTPAGTSIDVQNGWEENTHTQTISPYCIRVDGTIRRYFQHAHFIPIVGVGKRSAYELVHSDLPRQHSFGTTLRFTGPVPADSRQWTPLVRNCVTR